MNSCDKQTKWLIAIILVGSGLIIGGFIGAYDAIDKAGETLKNEATIPEHESESVSNGALTPVSSDDLAYANQQRHLTWPDAGKGHCLLVLVKPPHNEPDELTNSNTIRLPIEYCSAVVLSIKDLVKEGFIDPQELLFKNPL